MKKNMPKLADEIIQGKDVKNFHQLSEERKLELYYYMKLNREVENRLSNLYRQGKIVGGLYSSLGQEATSVGTAYALAKGDMLAPMIRNLGSMLVRGYSPKDVFTQYMARKTSPTGGKDCNLHFGDIKGKGVIACTSMLGDLIPVMVGVALASKMRGNKSVALTYIGDGGTSTAAFHEGCNLAGVQKVPLVLIVENNQWAYSTPSENQFNVKDLAIRGVGYGMTSYIVDGNDVLEVYKVTKKAVEDARSGKGPSMIEAKTFRRKGHAEHDQADYVPKEIRQEWEKKDPVDNYEKYLFTNELMTKREWENTLARIKKEIDEAVEFAENSPMPEGPEALKGVYADESITRYTKWWEK